MTNVRKLCGPMAHKNIVEVFGVGKLPHSMCWYIDMELCDLNLETYILRKWTSALHKSVPFFTNIETSPISIKISQIAATMNDIARGVVYIHSYDMVHRDLKPRNGKFSANIAHGFLVLYSHRQHAWKIADFGLSTEGNSQHNRTTHFARGTSSYRAPEILHKGTYTNKVDIWAVGCILYEVICREKAFSSDLDVLRYSDGAPLSMPHDLDIFEDERFEAAMRSLIPRIFNIDPIRRPSAAQLISAFLVAFSVPQVVDFKH